LECDLQQQTCQAEILNCEEDPLEPNNDPENPISLAPGFHPDLTICAIFGLPAEQADCWRIGLDEGERLIATATFDHQELDLDMFLFTELVIEVDASLSRTDDERIDFSAPTDGPYILCLYPQGPGAVTYDLRVTVR
jgi:hypothetical protein